MSTGMRKWMEKGCPDSLSLPAEVSIDREELRQLRDELAQYKNERDALRARIEVMEKQEPVATVRINAINGNPSVDFVPGHHYLHHNDKLYLAPGAQPAPSFADAYQGAMEEVAIWKRRALEAEDLNRKFIAEINGPMHMGEPAQPAPSLASNDVSPISEAKP